MFKSIQFKRKQRSFQFNKKRIIAGYLFILPFIIGFIALFLFPLVQSFIFSISDIQIKTGGYALVDRGFEHYIQALTVDADFRKALSSSFSQLAFNLPTIIVFSFFAATLLNKTFRGRGIARIIFFLPVILASGVIAAVESGDLLTAIVQSSYTSDIAATGATNFLGGFRLETIFQQINLPPQYTAFIIGAVNNLYGIISQSGVQILIFLAALQSIPSSLYEASNIEGATAWENFCKISFPMASPYILVNTVYTIIDSFTSANNSVMRRVMSESIGKFEYGYGSAMAWIYLVCIIVVLIVVVGIIKRFIFYYDN